LCVKNGTIKDLIDVGGTQDLGRDCTEGEKKPPWRLRGGGREGGKDKRRSTLEAERVLHMRGKELGPHQTARQDRILKKKRRRSRLHLGTEKLKGRSFE